jgi:hypothetical protein
MQEEKFLPVNWVDGMKINKSHFITQDNAVTYRMAQHTAGFLNEHNYGLLPSPVRNIPSVKMYVSVDNQQQVQIRIKQCRAFTRGGHYIEFDEDRSSAGGDFMISPLQLSIPSEELTGKTASYYIVVTVNPFDRIPCGLADVQEIPTRLPYARPLLQLSLVPVRESGKNLLGLYQLPLGVLKINESSALIDEDYIPPAMSVASHPQLLEIFSGIEQFYCNMEAYAIQIIQKILQKKQMNEMAAVAQKLCEQITLFTATHLADIKAVAPIQPPIFFINKVAAMARLFKNIIDCYTGSGKEEFINYCTEWCSVSQGELEGSIIALSNHTYDHLNIHESIRKITDFMEVMNNLFNSLSRLDYIGKRRDAGIFVKEKKVIEEYEQPVKRRSFLAD